MIRIKCGQPDGWHIFFAISSAGLIGFYRFSHFNIMLMIIVNNVYIVVWMIGAQFAD